MAEDKTKFLKQLIPNDIRIKHAEYFGQYIIVYAKHIVANYGSYNWEDEEFRHFCKQNKITQKGNKNKKYQENHFCFRATKEKGKDENDIAFHFLRHVRNAFAHGNVVVRNIGKTKSTFYELTDINGMDVTMKGVIRVDLLWEMIRLLMVTRKET